MKKLALTALFLGAIGLSQSVQAEIIFSCKTTNNKYIEVNKLNNDIYEYKFGSASKNELTLRNKKSELLGRSERWSGIGRGRWSIMSFQKGEYIYQVYVNLDSIDHTTESGVDVKYKGQQLTRILCTEETAKSNFDDEEFAW